jgi:butyrate kinase
MKSERLLVINPGSTSTKIAVYDDETALFVESIQHPQEEIASFARIADQYEYREGHILRVLEAHGIEQNTLTAIISRGGLLPPVESGAYIVNDDMVWQLRNKPENEHASNLGGLIAKAIADRLGLVAYIYDPITVDEMEPIARVSGLPEFSRKSMSHALNMRAAAHRYARQTGRPYESLSLIVAHLGGGITMSLHQGGRMVDVISDEEGPFSPERAGGLPSFQTLQFAAESGMDFAALYRYVKTRGGLAGHLGVNDAREVERMIEEGDEKAALVYEAMAYNIAKHIGALAAAAAGQVDAVLLTGGVAHSAPLCGWIAQRVDFIAPVTVYAGENELESLVQGVLRVLKGQEVAHTFTRVI